MARSSFASEFHFSRQVSRLTGEPPAALRRRVMLERAAWRLQRGEGVAAVAADEGWSSPEVFSRAFRRSYGVPPSRAADVEFRLPAPNGLHFHPPESLWLDSAGDAQATPDVSAADGGARRRRHRVPDRDRPANSPKTNGPNEISPGQVVLDWDGEEPSVGAVLGAVVWTKEVWLASIEGRDQPRRAPDSRRPPRSPPTTTTSRRAGRRWSPTTPTQGRLGDTVIDALCDPPESFQLYGIVAHVLTYSAHRQGTGPHDARPPRRARRHAATHWTG